MKKLIILITLLITSFTCFSQIDTEKYIPLEPKIARLVIKDLIIGDASKEEIILLNEKITLLEETALYQNNIIKNLNLQNQNLNEVIEIKNKQIYYSSELNSKLNLSLKQEKIKNKFLSLSNGVTLLVGGVLLLTN